MCTAKFLLQYLYRIFSVRTLENLASTIELKIIFFSQENKFSSNWSSGQVEFSFDISAVFYLIFWLQKLLDSKKWSQILTNFAVRKKTFSSEVPLDSPSKFLSFCFFPEIKTFYLDMQNAVLTTLLMSEVFLPHFRNFLSILEKTFEIIIFWKRSILLENVPVVG